MKKWDIQPLLPQKPPNRSLPKFAWVIMSGTSNDKKNFITIQLPPFPKYAKMRIKWLGYFLVYPSAYSQDPCTDFLTINTSNDVVSRNDVLFRVSKTQFYISTPFFLQSANLLANFWRLSRYELKEIENRWFRTNAVNLMKKFQVQGVAPHQ